MFRKRKNIRLFERTNLAIASLKLAIEVQFEEEIQFRTQDFEVPNENTVSIGGDFTFSLKRTPEGTAALYKVHAEEVSLSVQGNIVMSERLIFCISLGGAHDTWYYAHAMYDYQVVRGVNYPSRIRVAPRRHPEGVALWKCGASAATVQEFPMFGPGALPVVGICGR